MAALGAAVAADSILGSLAESVLGVSAPAIGAWIGGILGTIAASLGFAKLFEWLGVNDTQQSAVVTFSQNNEAPLAQTIGQLMGAMLQITGATRELMDALAGSSSRIRTVYLPALANQAESTAINLINSSANAIDSWVRNSLANLNDQLQTYTDVQVSAAINDAYTYTRELAANAILQGEQYAAQVATGALDTATARINQVETVLAGGIAALNNQLVRDEQRTATEVGQLSGDIGRLAEGVATDIGTLSHEIDINKAAAAAAVGVVAGELTKWLKDCGDPLCNNLSGLGNALSILGSDAMLALVMGLLAKGIEDPAGASTLFYDALHVPLEGAVGSIVSAAGF